MRWSGVIEGFYGRPWSLAQRVEMLDWISAAGMNVFAYAPKDDIKLRAWWRELYDANELRALADLAGEAARRGVGFMVAIAPCLDIRYSDPGEIEALRLRLAQLQEIGVRLFALLFDDVPSGLRPEDAARFPSFAAAQCHVANAAWDALRGQGAARLFFCPTEYCALLAGGDVTKSAYLATLGASLASGIEVFWTGPAIVSQEITAESLREIGAVLKRKPVIWENFHANDYDVRRVNLGPLGGRSSGIRPEIAGLITNPNNEFEANFVPVRTTGRFVNAPAYDETEAAEEALRAWQARFRLAGPGELFEESELRLLVHLFYQPFACGPEVERVLRLAATLVAQPDAASDAWRAGHAEVRGLLDRVSRLFDRTTELRSRDLFYALQPYLWEAREELTALVRYLDWLSEDRAPGADFPHGERLPNTYQRGFAAAVQQLIPRRRGISRHGA
jgi:protein O-GlcNAcase/histone acetyltransferase